MTSLNARTILIAIFMFLIIGGVGAVLYRATAQHQIAGEPKDLDFETAAARLGGFSPLSDTPLIPNVKMFDEGGATVTFEAFRGKVVLFNLWATWCPPCIREMPDLDALQQDFSGRDFIVVPVASGKQGREEPAEFLRDRGLMALTTYYDPGSLFLRMFDVETLPTTFLIDKTGKMRGGVLGLADWHSDEAKDIIEALLNEPS